jgi:D-xylose transport system substrate-binding protein
MSYRRIAVLVGAIAVVAAACTGGASTSPSAAESAAASAPASAAASGGTAEACKVGISWNNFQQPRWAATDKPKMFAAIEAGGGEVIGDPDANLDNQRQLSDIDTLISKGAQVLVVLAQDNTAILPAIQKAKDANIPVIAYDRLIEDPTGSVLYITFDNVAVGKAEADAILAKVPKGNYVLIKGDKGDANASTFLPMGWDQAGLKDKVASGDIKIIGPADGTYTDGWKQELAKSNMEAIIDSANSSNQKIDAVLAENDSTAAGVAQALVGKNYEPYPPVSGQDGDPINLNNLAKGLQYVDVWKNSNELGKAAGQAALQLCKDPDASKVTVEVDASVAPAAGNTATDFVTPGGNTMKSIILKPTPLLAEDLDKPIDQGWWVTKEDICKGVVAGDPGAADCGV